MTEQRVTMSIVRKEKDIKRSLAYKLGRAYGAAKEKVKKTGTKGQELVKKHSPAIKAATKAGFLAGLRASKGVIKRTRVRPVKVTKTTTKKVTSRSNQRYVRSRRK